MSDEKRRRPAAPELDRELVRAIERGVVVPWIGAGFSRPLGFPNMRDLLLLLLAELHVDEFSVDIASNDVPQRDLERHQRFQRYTRDLMEGRRDYADVASDIREHLIPDDAEHKFFTALRTVLNRMDASHAPSGRDTEAPLDERVARSSFGHYFLRAIGFSRVVTTNYDRLLERHVFPHAAVITGKDFESIDYYTRIATADEVVVKLHGDIGRPTTIPFKQVEFEALYKQKQLKAFLTDLIQNHSLLFIGTSLSRSEAYYTYLRDIFREATTEGSCGARYKHFALLQTPPDADERADRTKRLRDVGIEPIWYETNDEEHSQIYEYLSNLAATRRRRTSPETLRGGWLRSAYDVQARPEYLETQLAFEAKASVVTFVTADLTNAIAQDEYLERDCIPTLKAKLANSPVVARLREDYWEKVLLGMKRRRDNLIARAGRDSGGMMVRALCSRPGVRKSLENAELAAKPAPDGTPGDPDALRRLIERYSYVFDVAEKSRALDVRLSDGFRMDAATSYTPDSYALIVSTYENGRANLVMAFATQASHGSFNTHLIEANTELVRERTAHAEEMWWSSTPEKQSLKDLREMVGEYEAKLKG